MNELTDKKLKTAVMNNIGDQLCKQFNERLVKEWKTEVRSNQMLKKINKIN